MTTKEKDRQMEIYKDFIKARVGDVTVASVCDKYKISRQAVYKIAGKVFDGNSNAYKKAIQQAKWEFIYQPTYDIVKGLKTDGQRKMFSKVLRAMMKDDFTVMDIAKFLKRGTGDRKIIYQYLK